MKNGKDILAFDYGASSGRAVVGTLDGGRLTLNEVYRFKNEPVHVGGDFFWDILSLYKHLKNGLLKAFYEYDVGSVAFDTWGADFGLIGKRGELLTNPYHYRHPHTADMLAEADKLLGAYNIFKYTGITMQPFNTLMQLMAMKRDGNVALANAQKLLFTPDLFNYFLTGETYSEQTLVSMTQLAVPAGGAWCGELLEKAGVNQKLLCDIIPPCVRIGELKKGIRDELNTSQSPDIYSTASHDTAAAVAAVPADTDDFLYISSGTWSLLGTILDEPVLTEEAFAGGYTNEGTADGRIRFLKNIMGLWLIQECKRDYELSGKAATFTEIAEMSAKAPAFKCFINPDDEIFYSPLQMNAKIRGHCKKTGQYVPQGLGEIGRCIFESLAFAYRAAIENLELITKKKYSKLYIVGGGSNNELLNQFTANAVGKPVVAGIPEATSVGNILCQLKGRGFISSLNEGREITRNSFELREYEPRDTGAWNENYELFKLKTEVFRF